MMALLVLITLLCCVGLLGLGGLMGYGIRQRLGEQRRVVGWVRGPAVVSRVPCFLHPRMDYAAGWVPGRQTVDLERRRLRQERSETPGLTLGEDIAARFEPFGERQKHLRTFRHRLDLVYARESMGDLSDPVAGAGWRLRGQALLAK